MGAEGAAVGQPDQQVLPAGDDLADGGAGEVEGRQLRDPELAAQQRRAGQGGVHPLGRQPHGVSSGTCPVSLPGVEPAPMV